ncbi:hypothetical protein UYO_3151, partial [Lachnospiraceae bacterium JC7]
AKYIPKEFIEVYEPSVSQRLNKKKSGEESISMSSNDDELLGM